MATGAFSSAFNRRNRLNVRMSKITIKRLLKCIFQVLFSFQSDLTYPTLSDEKTGVLEETDISTKD